VDLWRTAGAVDDARSTEDVAGDPEDQGDDAEAEERGQEAEAEGREDPHPRAADRGLGGGTGSGPSVAGQRP
jgi:hypothetical protein